MSLCLVSGTPLYGNSCRAVTVWNNTSGVAQRLHQITKCTHTHTHTHTHTPPPSPQCDSSFHFHKAFVHVSFQGQVEHRASFFVLMCSYLWGDISYECSYFTSVSKIHSAFKPDRVHPSHQVFVSLYSLWVAKCPQLGPCKLRLCTAVDVTAFGVVHQHQTTIIRIELLQVYNEKPEGQKARILQFSADFETSLFGQSCWEFMYFLQIKRTATSL